MMMVWKVTVTSPAGRCRLLEPGIGTSPYASYLSNKNVLPISMATNPMPVIAIVKTATAVRILGAEPRLMKRSLSCRHRCRMIMSAPPDDHVGTAS